MTRQIAGDDRPKQFCALTGGETLLGQTRKRIARVIPEQQVMLILTRPHERFYADQVREIQARNLLIQPRNQGTAPAIAYSLSRLNTIAPDSVVGFFPSDHHFKSDNVFADAVTKAFAHVEGHGEHVLLLGITPDTAEESYGWIEPGSRLSRPGENAVFEVRSFWEKPSKMKASQLMARGGLWNTFVMIGRVEVFLGMIRRSLPKLVESFESLSNAALPGMEDSALEDLYSKIPPSNFSQEVLSVCPSDLAVFPARGLGWADLGEPKRVLSTLRLRTSSIPSRLTPKGAFI